jgi:transposase
MNTLFNFDKDNMIIQIGNGFGIKVIENKVNIYRNGLMLKETEIKSGLDKRVLVVDLVEKSGVSKMKLSKALSVSRTSIDTWIKVFRQKGIEGLVNSSKKAVGRKKMSVVRPEGNKFKEIGQENKGQRLLLEKQNLRIQFPESELTQETAKQANFNQEQEYRENRYAGSFLYWAVIQHQFKFMQSVESIFGRYSTVIYLFVMMHVNRISSIEQIKTVFKKEFGCLLGLHILFSSPKLWKMIHEAVALKKSLVLRKHFFHYQMRKGLVSLWYLFIDGHYIPYTGKEKVHKNFHTQRAMMEPGQNEIFIHDIQGRIVYFDLQEGKGNMLEVIKEQSKTIAPYLGNEQPLFVVDKEIWGVDNFLSLQNCRFITWEKNTNVEETGSIDAGLFSEPFELKDTEYQVYETSKVYKNIKGSKIKLRRIIIWNKKTGKRPVAVALDEYEDTLTLANAMLNRWGKSENSFKHMGNRTKMHYNPVIEISRDSQNQEILNPQFIKLDKGLSKLKRQLSKTERKIGQKPLTLKKDGSIRKNQSRNDLLEQRKKLQLQIQDMKAKLEKCQQRVDGSSIEGKKQFKVIETEAKNLWDISETLMWNSRKYLSKLLEEYLPNERDLLPVLDAITSSKGKVKITKDAVIVVLEALERKQFYQAQLQLCRKLNQMNVRFSNQKILFFDVE